MTVKRVTVTSIPETFVGYVPSVVAHIVSLYPWCTLLIPVISLKHAFDLHRTLVDASILPSLLGRLSHSQALQCQWQRNRDSLTRRGGGLRHQNKSSVKFSQLESCPLESGPT